MVSMINYCRPPLRLARATHAFTIVELMVTVAIIGIVSSVAFTTSQAAWRRERANAATLELAGWLEEISQSPEQNGVACEIVVNTGTLNPGGNLATVTPANCSTSANLFLPGLNNNETYQVAVSGAVAGAGTTQRWWSTPRGAISTTAPATNTGSSATDISVRISVGGNPPVRCVRLSGTLGLIRLGRNNTTGNSNLDCDTWSVR
jgi:prepilin-type N-terminal cleavage/methylation domain-containing protein